MNEELFYEPEKWRETTTTEEKNNFCRTPYNFNCKAIDSSPITVSDQLSYQLVSYQYSFLVIKLIIKEKMSRFIRAIRTPSKAIMQPLQYGAAITAPKYNFAVRYFGAATGNEV